MSIRDEAIRDPLWVLADFAPRELENRAALQWAGDVLAALAPYVVLRSEMEQVGWRCDRIVGPKRWMKCAHSAPCGLVYRVRAGGEDRAFLASLVPTEEPSAFLGDGAP